MQRQVAALLLGSMSVWSTSLARAEPLITPAEAALPAPPEAGLTMRGLTRGPGVELVSPAEAKPTKSPLQLKIRFVGRNNAAIDKDSVKVTYIRTPAVDLTSRLKAHISPDGIEMKDAEVPAGTHAIRVDVKDNQGRSATAIFKLVVGNL